MNTLEMLGFGEGDADKHYAHNSLFSHCGKGVARSFCSSFQLITRRAGYIGIQSVGVAKVVQWGAGKL